VASLISTSLEGIKIVPLGTRGLDSVAPKHKYRKIFHHATISQQASDALKAEALDDVLAEAATVSVETAKFVFPLGAKKTSKVEDALREMCIGRGWDEIGPVEEGKRGIERDMLLFRSKGTSEA